MGPNHASLKASPILSFLNLLFLLFNIYFFNFVTRTMTRISIWLKHIEMKNLIGITISQIKETQLYG